MKKSLKIGIVLNYKSAEKKKDELLSINSKKMKWLSLADDPKYNELVVRKKKANSEKVGKYVPADVAIGLYIEYHYPNIEVDYIQPDEISTARFKENTIVFIIIYDLLEAFHLADKLKFKKFKAALKNSNNVYPPYKYQKFINNKCNYYKYLDNKGIPVAPTHCVSKEKLFKKSPNNYVNKLLSKIKSNKWESVIAKPVYGQESKDFSKFLANPDGLECQKKKMLKYFRRNIPKYKSIVIQEYIKGFDKNNPEIRTYYINGKYMYSIVTTSTKVESPIQEGGKYKIPQKTWNYAKKLSMRTMKALPKFNMCGNHKNPILTRIDIGTGLQGVPHEMFINEVEFVPSLYVEDQKNPVIEKIAESLKDVGEIYHRCKLPIKVKF